MTLSDLTPARSDIANHYDLFVIGGGINGAGVARDAAGRGYSGCAVRLWGLWRGHLFRIHQINPRWTALPAVLQIPAGCRITAGTRDAVAYGTSHHLAHAFRIAAP